jgi:hypothetical protein
MESIRLSKTSVLTYLNREVMFAPLHADANTNSKRKYSSNTFAISRLERGGWSAPRSGHFTPSKDPVFIDQETRCVAGPVWTGTENLTPEIRCPVRPARSESPQILYQDDMPQTTTVYDASVESHGRHVGILYENYFLCGVSGRTIVS